jgi:hypothetical protein
VIVVQNVRVWTTSHLELNYFRFGSSMTMGQSFYTSILARSIGVGTGRYLRAREEIIMLNEDINELLKAFIILDKLTDELNARSDELYGTGNVWCSMRDILEKYLGEDFYNNLSGILKKRGLG